MKSLNKIVKEKVILKYILEDISELNEIDFKKIIPQKGIIEKSIELSYKHKDKVLVIDYLRKLQSTKSDLGEKNE